MTDFQRARQPDQVNLRRECLLAAAADLFDAQGAAGAGLNAIAAKAGFTKSNVYRYFESREDVLLALLLDEFGRLADLLEASILARPEGDIDGISESIALCYAGQPRCCHLMSIYATILEQNVSESKIESVKRHLAAQTETVIAALMTRLSSRREDCAWAMAMTSALVAGMWPAVYPSPAAAAVLAKPEFAGMRLKLERDLNRAIAALLGSISQTSRR